MNAEALFSVQKNIEICRNGHFVSRASDYIIYSVEAAVIDKVIAQYGPCKTSSTVGLLRNLTVCQLRKSAPL